MVQVMAQARLAAWHVLLAHTRRRQATVLVRHAILMPILAQQRQREPAKPDISVPPRQATALLVLQIPTRLLLEMDQP